MGDIVSFTVPGQPVPKGRARAFRRGNFIGHYTPDKTANYENLVKLAAAGSMKGKDMITGGAIVVIDLYMQIPESWSAVRKREAVEGKIRPITKPDIDNSLKGIFDAMNGIVWDDDKQAVDVRIRKRYSSNPCAVVSVKPIG